MSASVLPHQSQRRRSRKRSDDEGTGGPDTCNSQSGRKGEVEVHSLLHSPGVPGLTGLWNPFLLAEIWMGAQRGAEDTEENAVCPYSPEVDTWFMAAR